MRKFNLAITLTPNPNQRKGRPHTIRPRGMKLRKLERVANNDRTPEPAQNWHTKPVSLTPQCGFDL